MRTYEIKYQDKSRSTVKAAGFRVEHDGITFYDDSGETIIFTRAVQDVWQIPDAEANPLSVLKSTGEPAKEPASHKDYPEPT